MKYVALIALCGAASGCTGVVRLEPVAPPPATVTVTAGTPAPPEAPAAEAQPAPPVQAAQPAPPVQASTDEQPVVNIEITSEDPEEVQATSEPPDPIYEEQTDMPGPGYIWVGGYWGWTGGDWSWAPGRWVVQPAGRVYIEPYYERVNGQVVYVRGYWGAPGAPVRYYGGDRIRWGRPARPVGYVRGVYRPVERRPGLPPGSRGAAFYARGTGSVRPMPRTTSPAYRAGVRAGEAREAARDEHEQREVNHEQREVNHEQREVNHEQHEVNHEQREVNHEQREVNHEQREVNHEQAHTAPAPHPQQQQHNAPAPHQQPKHH
jgi:hypothetical protein